MPAAQTSNGYIYLNVTDLFCAWNVYRGVLASAHIVTRQPGCLSAWIAASIRRGPGSARVIRECGLERIRRAHYQEKVPRTQGIYTFPDRESADRARAEWQLPHLSADNLAEVALSDVRRLSRHDSNWITYHNDDPDPNWKQAYWKGEPCPGHTAIWEQLVEGHVVIYGTSLRQRAYEVVKASAPDSLMFLETGRIAALLGSEVGSIAAFIVPQGGDYAMMYYLNMEEAEDPGFLAKMKAYMCSGAPVNRQDIAPFVKRGTWGSTPNFMSQTLVIPKSEMPHFADFL